MSNNSLSKNFAIDETIWNNMVESDSSCMTIEPMCNACCISKAMGKNSESEIINCFLLRNLLHIYVRQYIQGDSGGICTILGNDSMSDSKQGSS